MASIDDRRWAKRDGKKVATGFKGPKPWRARWREYAGGPQKTAHFARKVDAEAHLAQVQHQLLTGSYVDPKAGRMTVRSYAEEWMQRRHWRPATRDRVEREMRLHILPTLGDRPLASVRRPHVEEWATALELAPSSVATVHATLVALFTAAVDDGRLMKNPAAGARLPQIDRVPFVPMEVEEIRRFSGAMPEHIRAAAVLVAATGLRQGELFGLTVDRVNFLRRELRVDRQLWTPKAGKPFLAPVKSARSNRTVALSSVALDAVSAHLKAFGEGEGGHVFHIEGRPVSRAMAAAYARRACKRSALSGRTWHDLRHHHASVLLSEGVSPALVAERLGHDVATLLKTYAHVIRSDDDRVRAIVDATLGVSAEDWLRTKAAP